MALSAAVENKLKKNYVQGVAALVVYFDMGTHGFWEDEIRADLVACTRPALGPFKSVWVIWSDRLWR